MSAMTLRRLPHLVWLLAVWVALWGQVSVANLLSGVVVITLVALVFTDVGPRPVSALRVGGALRLAAWFVKALVLSTFQVAWTVLRRRPVRPAVIAFPMRDCGDAVVTLVADLITLTPGTLTLDVRSDGDDAVLYVHVLDLDDEDTIRAELDELQRLAIRAFGGRAALAHLEEATS